MLVLLIIFMVVTPLLEKDIEVRVPDDTDQETEPRSRRTSWWSASTRAGNVKLNSRAAATTEYKTRMKRVLAAKSYEEKLVFFIPDDKAPYPRVVQTLDWTRSAGAYILGVVTEPVAGVLPGGAPAPGTEPGGAPAAPGRLRRRLPGPTGGTK